MQYKRINAAGRLDDMRLGIQCLLSDDPDAALAMAQTLHALNAERRHIEAEMQAGALTTLETLDVEDQYTISLYQPDWHQGVIGILASRLKERYHRPAITFARADALGDDNVLLKGSGRSIAGLHLRDALDLVTKRKPDLIIKFGGHAMAAGLTIRQADFFIFQTTFEAVVRELLEQADLQAVMLTDGGLDTGEMHLAHAQLLNQVVWGQGFAAPVFDDVFAIINQRIVGEKHLKLYVEKQGQRFDAIFFGQTTFLPDKARLVYQLQVNRYRGLQTVQLQVLHAQALPIA